LIPIEQALSPKPDPIVASPGDQSHVFILQLLLTIWRPAHAVDPEGIVPKFLHAPGIVFRVGEDADHPIAGGSGQDESVLVGREADGVDTALVEVSMLGEEDPVGGAALAVDEDGAVEGAGGKDRSELGVGPRYFPDRAGLVVLEGSGMVVGVLGDVEDLDGTVGGTCRELATVIIELSVVDHVVVLGVDIDGLWCSVIFLFGLLLLVVLSCWVST